MSLIGFKSMKKQTILHVNDLSPRNILFCAGSFSVAVLSICGLGMAWSILLGVTIVAVCAVKNKLNNGEFEKEGSFENVYSDSKIVSKRQRMFAKRKEKYERKMKQDDDDLEDSTPNQLPSLPDDVLGGANYEHFIEYDSVFGNSSLSSGRKTGRTIPSLRSPQPLLSAFNSRISKRESLTDSLLYQSQLSSPRSVFGNLHNRIAQSPLSSTLTVKEAKLLANRSQNVHKAISPAGGLYFSRIRQDFEHSSIVSPDGLQTPKRGLKSKQENSYISADSPEVSFSKEAVVKALQQKVASKRKRSMYGSVEFKDDETEQGMKKRRIQNEVLYTTVDEFQNDKIQYNEAKGKTKNKTLLSKRPYIEDEIGENSDTHSKQVEKVNGKKNKYGIDENEVDSINAEDDMDIDKSQSKRKANDDSDYQSKEKKNREDEGKLTKKSGKKQTPKTKKTPKKKKTPVRSVETQTPTKVVGEGDKKVQQNDSPNTPLTKTTPFKRTLTSGIASTPSPTPERKKRIPLYSGSLAYIENIEAGREEYGERGLTCEAYKADKKAALERTIAFINGEDDEGTAECSTVVTSAVASSILSSQTSKPVPPINESSSEKPAVVMSQLSSTAALSALVSSSLTPSSTTSIQFGLQPSSFTFAAASQKTAAPETKPASSIGAVVSKSPFSLTTSQPVSFPTATVGTTATTQPESTISTAQAPLQSLAPSLKTGFSFGATALPTASVAMGGFSFGAPASSTSASSGTTNVTFGQGVDASTKSSTASSLAVSSLAVVSSADASSTTKAAAASFSLAPKSESTAAVLGGFSFSSKETKTVAPSFNFGSSQLTGTLPAAGASLKAAQTTTVVPSVSTTDNLPKPFGGFSFGPASSNTKASTISFGMTGAASSIAPTNPSTAAAPSFSFAGFGSSADSSSSTTTTSSASLGGFSFGPAKPTAPPASVSTGSSGFGGFASGSKQGGASSGGFSFGASASLGAGKSTTSSVVFQSNSQVSSAPGSFFKTPLAQDTNVFGSPAAPSTGGIFGAVANPPQKSQNAFGSSSVTQQSSIFATPAASQTASGFAPQTAPTSTAPGLFALAQTPSASSSVFGASAPTVGTSGSMFGQSNQPGSQPFAIQPVATTSSTSIFGTSIPTTGFSFGSESKPIFGAANPPQTSAPTGGFSFGASTTSTGTGSVFGQFGSSNATQNPFASGTGFGKPAPSAPSTTTGGFSFGAGTQNTFGQSTSNTPSFGASSVFGTSSAPAQMGGFDFSAAANASKPATFSFVGGAAAPSGGFASRPGTPTQFASAPPAGSDVMSTPQLQPGGFAIGSGSVANRATVKGRRRVRR